MYGKRVCLSVRREVKDMITIKPLDFRTNLKRYMDFAFRGEPIVIARPKDENVVIVSERDYSELLKAKQNAEYLEHLDHSYRQLEQSHTISFSMDELRAMESDDWEPTQKVLDWMKRMESCKAWEYMWN